ncbi:MAG: sigma 54-interacting transcriptional regulator [Polyangiaceae bacterium]
MAEQKKAVVVVSFAALHGDPYARDWKTGRFVGNPPDAPDRWGPTLRALGDRRSELYGCVSNWYYLCHPEKTEGREIGVSANDVGEETRQAIAKHLPLDIRPNFQPLTWESSRPPTDHGHLFEMAAAKLREIRRKHPRSPLVLVLNSGTAQMHAALLLAGSVGIVDGPIRLVQIERNEGARLRPDKPIVDVTLELHTVLQVARATKPAGVLGEEAPTAEYDQATSPALRKVVELARRAARVPFPVLLRGERGVGKSQLARFIRAWSPHRKAERDDRWPAVACGQFADPSRLMVELCGSVEGAFTDAKHRGGLLALAHEDTLFLDEIHDLKGENQRVLMRVLEDGKYYPLGSSEPQTSKFRLITGTNLPDHELRTRLGPDFYDRIRDIEIEVPPLRACKEDLPWMWGAAWSHVADRARLDPRRLDEHMSAIVRRLRLEELPGNWRDLRRLAVSFAVVLDATDEPTEATVQTALDEFFGMPGAPAATTSEAILRSGRERTRLKNLEQTLGPNLEKFWVKCDGTRTPRMVLTEMLGGL